MARFKVARPQYEVNLRKWAPGRVAQLRLFLSHLENAINPSLAAQVSQTPSRKFNEFIPKIVEQDISAEVEYREIRVKFDEPKGLKNFLFYECDIGTTEFFSVFDRATSPIPSFVFTNLVDDTTYFMRVRVVAKNGEVGPFSATFNAKTPFSQGFGLFDGTEIKSLIATNTFQPIFNRTYTSIGGKVYYSIDYEIAVQIVNSTTFNLEWSDVELQWIVDSAQVGQNFLVTTYGTNNTASGLGNDMVAVTDNIGDATFVDADDVLFIPGTFLLERRGTFIQKFSTLTAATHTIQLKARVIPASAHPFPNNFQFDPAQTSPIFRSNANITLRNFNIFEVLVS